VGLAKQLDFMALLKRLLVALNFLAQLWSLCGEMLRSQQLAESVLLAVLVKKLVQRQRAFHLHLQHPLFEQRQSHLQQLRELHPLVADLARVFLGRSSQTAKPQILREQYLGA
jgi:hypothetical protein